jgi:hypothetical protein
MSVNGSGGNGHRGSHPVGLRAEVEEASALLAWRGAVQSARTVLLEASRLHDAGSGGSLGTVLVGLRRLEGQIDGQLSSPDPAGRPAPAS